MSGEPAALLMIPPGRRAGEVRSNDKLGGSEPTCRLFQIFGKPSNKAWPLISAEDALFGVVPSYHWTLPNLVALVGGETEKVSLVMGKCDQNRGNPGFSRVLENRLELHVWLQSGVRPAKRIRRRTHGRSQALNGLEPDKRWRKHAFELSLKIRDLGRRGSRQVGRIRREPSRVSTAKLGERTDFFASHEGHLTSELSGEPAALPMVPPGRRAGEVRSNDKLGAGSIAVW